MFSSGTPSLESVCATDENDEPLSPRPYPRGGARADAPESDADDVRGPSVFKELPRRGKIDLGEEAVMRVTLRDARPYPRRERHLPYPRERALEPFRPQGELLRPFSPRCPEDVSRGYRGPPERGAYLGYAVLLREEAVGHAGFEPAELHEKLGGPLGRPRAP